MSYAMRPQPPVQTILDVELSKYMAAGWNVAHRTESTAVVSSPGGRVNHILHLILTLFTLGLWAPVWILVALTTPSARRLTLTVQPDGGVAATRPDGRPLPSARARFWKQGPGLAIIILSVFAVLMIAGVLNSL